MNTITVLKLFLSSIAAFLLPIKGLIIIMGLVVALDLITGIYASRKNKEAITSHKLFNTIIKLCFYSTIIIISYMIDIHIFNGMFPLFNIPCGISKFATVFIIGIESVSIDENSQRVGNKPFKIWFKKFYNILKGYKKDLTELAKKE